MKWVQYPNVRPIHRQASRQQAQRGGVQWKYDMPIWARVFIGFSGFVAFIGSLGLVACGLFLAYYICVIFLGL